MTDPMELWVPVNKIALSGTDVCSFSTLPSQTSPQPGDPTTASIERNGDIAIGIDSASGVPSTVVHFMMRNTAYVFDDNNPIAVQIAPIANCNYITPGPLPDGITMQWENTGFSITIPKSTTNQTYEYAIQVHPKAGGAGKWLHPKIRNDTIVNKPAPDPFHKFILSEPYLALALVAVIVFGIGLFAGRRWRK